MEIMNNFYERLDGLMLCAGLGLCMAAFYIHAAANPNWQRVSLNCDRWLRTVRLENADMC